MWAVFAQIFLKDSICFVFETKIKILLIYIEQIFLQLN